MTSARTFLASMMLAMSAVLAIATGPAAAQGPADRPASQCIALADAGQSPIRLASLDRTALAEAEVNISFVGHATFRIQSAGGVVIATDYTGYAGSGRTPDVVTMNHAHSTHYTNFPDPQIRHVLRGWPTEGAPARHGLKAGDVFIRNVTTDIRGWDGLREKDGNSIFIFEVAGMCIGHLGHLHHTLGPEYLGLIGQLDVVMVPVDGAYTMDQDAMLEVLKLLKARLILPMHYFGQATLSRFVAKLDESFDVATSKEPSVTVSVATLPQKPQVLVLPGFEMTSPQ
jgi:L-ascorbate metabolism protein UlaG (beta-lactamase superfamily)